MSRGYSVKEIYYTLQGEGAQAGRAAVFLRFTGCNLWSGREADRAKGAGGCARWCDTDFVGTDGPGGGSFRRRARSPTRSLGPGLRRERARGRWWCAPGANPACSSTRPW